MVITVSMPQMGESVVEGTVEKWRVREGERVERDQILCEITTDKVDAEIPAPESGVVTKLLVGEGETVEVGAGLVELEPAGTATTQALAPPSEAGTQASPVPVRSAGPADSVRTTPLARRMAEAHGVDLRSVTSGPGGRIGKADLRAHLERSAGGPTAPAPQAAPERATAPGTLGEFLGRMRVPVHRTQEGDTVVPFTAIRRRIAEHMVVSKIVSPHVGTVAEVDMHRIVELRRRVKADFERANGFGLSYLPFVVQATIRALRDYPRLNATVVGDSIVERPGIHIGVAVETERGLLVPVVRDADRYSLSGVALAIHDLATRARNREITADDLYGGTFTVTNPGREGNLYGFAVINQPQVGILRTGEVKKRPVVIAGPDGEDSIVIHPMMYLALSYDHRIIDGVTGNGFLYRVAGYLEAGEFEL